MNEPSDLKNDWPDGPANEARDAQGLRPCLGATSLGCRAIRYNRVRPEAANSRVASRTRPFLLLLDFGLIVIFCLCVLFPESLSVLCEPSLDPLLFLVKRTTNPWYYRVSYWRVKTTKIEFGSLSGFLSLEVI